MTILKTLEIFWKTYTASQKIEMKARENVIKYIEYLLVEEYFNWAIYTGEITMPPGKESYSNHPVLGYADKAYQENKYGLKLGIQLDASKETGIRFTRFKNMDGMVCPIDISKLDMRRLQPLIKTCLHKNKLLMFQSEDVRLEILKSNPLYKGKIK